MDGFKRISSPLLLICSLTIIAISATSDTINTSQSIRDGETLVSSGGMFELGFFSPGNSTNRYVGIRYKNISVETYVWVANRQAPLTTRSGVLRVSAPGILVLFNDTNGNIIWSSNTSSTTVGSPAAQILDSGNLVVKAENDDRPQNFLWQSFDHPTDTIIPGMSVGWNLVTGVETYLSSWRSNDDPAPGDYSSHLDPTGYPQNLFKRGENVLYRFGPWNGVQLIGAADINSHDPIFRLSLLMNENEVKYREDILRTSVISRITVHPDGISRRWTWNSRTKEWIVYTSMASDNCDTYNMCGPHGVCNVGSSPPCGCLDRFVPRDVEGWNGIDWLDGCVRRIPLSCQGDVFLKYSGIKLPDSRNSSFNERIRTLADCEVECSRNCNCTAYTQLDVREGGNGCLFYHGELVDMRTLSSGGEDLCIRLASGENEFKGKRRVVFIASLTSLTIVVIVSLILLLILYWKRNKQRSGNEVAVAGHFSGSDVVQDADLHFFNLSLILKATDHFALSNKIGEGGFGPVYKGKLEDGLEIAVKRLSKTSSQGVDELKNEVILIAKLQHRNLVRILGCCVEGEENMLVYEYMPNNSLDLILFDETKSMVLDWQTRYNIINGIAKGLLYLHQDSRLRIIHRDLKASNILLDADMNPKISDFGLAKGFGGNETEAKTGRVVGTYGYMSPEYAIDGLFSIKSDVFSFGVLVLEIVSGKRNRGFALNDHSLNLLGHAWMLYQGDKTCKLVDTSFGGLFDMSEALRSIHVELLCVQKRPEDRPNMSSVVFMLGNEVALPTIKEPGFFTERDVSAGKTFSRSNFGHNYLTGG